MDKEEEINRRIEMLRRKNERLMQRHQEVEADRKSAEKYGQSFSSTGPKYQDSNRDSNNSQQNQKMSSPFSRAHMDEPIDDYQPNYQRNRRSTPRGRGNTSNQSNPRGRGVRRLQDYEAKRLENYRLMEEEMTQTTTEGDSPALRGVSNFLDDPRRKGDLDPEERWKSTRHKGSYGGVNFDNVKVGARSRGRGYRDGRRGRGRGRGMSKLQASAEYTGRERQDQERWQAMRDAADREIMARSKNAQGKWRREWDAEKGAEAQSGPDHENDYLERYNDPPRSSRGGGRGRRGSGRGQRGSHSNQSGRSSSDTLEVTEETQKDANPVQQEEDFPIEEPPGKETNTGKPQRIRKKPMKSPKHLLQQRSQTPSSKDGTEVWAQNSHHSDETGAEWKNNPDQSGEQWVLTSDGNRKPAIDERMLEQQEVGATIYSQQLGRGWGSEKNIKATKAWVIDTEKAGATKEQPEESELTGSVPDEVNYPKTEPNVAGLKQESASAKVGSPRLKHKSIGLTVEIGKGGTRCVKSKPSSTSDPAETNNEAKASPVAASPLSPDFLKTPDGLVKVTDWAAEVDMQSPTYESRQLQLETELAKQKLVPEEATSNKAENGAGQKTEVSDNNDHVAPLNKSSSTVTKSENITADSGAGNSNDLRNTDGAGNEMTKELPDRNLSADTHSELKTRNAPVIDDRNIENSMNKSPNGKSSADHSHQVAVQNDSCKNEESDRISHEPSTELLSSCEPTSNIKTISDCSNVQKEEESESLLINKNVEKPDEVVGNDDDAQNVEAREDGNDEFFECDEDQLSDVRKEHDERASANEPLSDSATIQDDGAMFDAKGVGTSDKLGTSDSADGNANC